MQVKDGLSRVCSVIGDEPVAALIDSLCLGSADAQVDHSVKGALVELSEIAQRGNVLPWHDKKVNGGLRIDIAKRDGMLIFSHEFRSKLPCDNSAKKTMGRHF